LQSALLGKDQMRQYLHKIGVNLIDLRTNAVVLTWGGSDLMPEQLLTAIGTDLSGLSIRQFETKWGIGN